MIILKSFIFFHQLSIPGCIYSAVTYLMQFGKAYCGDGCTQPWIERDGNPGFGGNDVAIKIGDMIGQGVKTSSDCSTW